MIANKEEIRVGQVIVHILDSTVGMPVLSDTVLDYGSDFADFIKAHIFKTDNSDDIRRCVFEEESAIYSYLQEWNSENFVDLSKKIAEELFTIMNQNIEIPQADLIIAEYELEKRKYLAILKMDYKSFYTHLTNSDPWGNNNEIIRQKAILPGENQKLSEAALLDFEAPQYVRLTEKKYEINGVKSYYFSKLFLKCKASLSAKSRLNLVSKAVSEVQKKFYHESEQFEVQMETKSIINEEFSKDGVLDVPVVMDKIFKEHPNMRKEVEEKLEKYNLANTTVDPQNPTTTKKFTKQHLMTDTGIELKIPMEEYNNKDRIEFITNSDGTISVLIKNIGCIESK